MTDKQKFSKSMLTVKLAKLNYIQSSGWILERLAEADNMDWKKAPPWLPWYLLLLWRYSAKYSKGKAAIPLEASQAIYAYYHGYINSRSDDYLGTPAHDIFKFFLRLAHQQFPFQLGLTGLKYKLARQSIFFASFDTILKEKFGITSSDFLKSSFLLFSLAENNQRKIHASIYQSLKKPEAIAAGGVFLDLISFSLDDLASYSNRSIRMDGHEIYDYSFFKSTPFLKAGQNHYLVSKAFLYELMSHGLYNLLKHEKTVGAKLGDVFQEYAERRILQAYPHCLTEKAIESRLPTGNKPSKVDAIIPTDSALLLLEYKATELPEAIQVDPSDKNMEELKNAIGKGISQAHKTLALLTENSSLFPEVDLSKPAYLFIVTYRQTYLGTADRYWTTLEPILRSKYGLSDLTALKPENIFFLNIEDLDWLLSVKERLDEVIAAARTAFGNNQAHDFTQVIAKFVAKNYKDEELDGRFNLVFNECLKDMGMTSEQIARLNE